MEEKFLKPVVDIIFKLLFGDERSIEILTAFLKSVLDFSSDEYDVVTIVDPHLLRDYEGDKLGILDVKVVLKSGAVVNIEIQILPIEELRRRPAYYNAKMLTEQLGSGDKYDKINRVVTIAITDYVLIPESKNYRHGFDYSDLKNKVTLTNISEIHTLELPKLPPSNDGTNLWGWMKFLSAESKEDVDMVAEKNPQIKKAAVRLMEISSDKKARMLYESRLKAQRDAWAREDYVAKEAAKEADKAARTDERLAMARVMLANGEPIEKIIMYTNLTHEEINELQNIG